MAVKEKKFSKFKWFHANRFKILIWTFIIVIPLSLILLAYAGSYSTYKKVSFDTESTEVISSFDSIDDIELFTLNFEWATLRYPEFDTNGDVSRNGYYQFRLSYTESANYNISSINATGVLQTDWVDNYALGSTIGLREDSNTSMLITFNDVLPQRTLLFINVTDPNLYIKLDITYYSAGQSVTATQYIKIKLKDYNPGTVLD